MRKAPLFCAVMALLLILLAFQLLLPPRETSALENRVLAQRPHFSLSALTDSHWSDSFEAFAADQMPARDVFVSIYTGMRALAGHRLTNDVISGAEGRLFDRGDGWSGRSVRQNAAALADLQAQTGVPVYLLAVPSAAAVYPEALPRWAPGADEGALLGIAEEEIQVIPLLSALEAAKGEGPLYYLTDHHWTARGARVGYLSVCAALGLAPAQEWPLQTLPGFHGSFFARCPVPWQKADAFSYPETAGIRLIAEGREKDGLVDREQLKGRDWYASLLYGNHGMMELINEKEGEGTLFVIKDSYANALLPALARHYHRIVAVDARYFSGNIVDAVKESKGDKVLCINGVSSLASGRTLALLEGL